MAPPWEAFPHVPAGSIGWRMGDGEDYWLSFANWFAGRSADEKDRFAADHPEPEGWTGFYRQLGIQAA